MSTSSRNHTNTPTHQHDLDEYQYGTQYWIVKSINNITTEIIGDLIEITNPFKNKILIKQQQKTTCKQHAYI